MTGNHGDFQIGSMRFLKPVSLFWLAVGSVVWGQTLNFQQREELTVEQRVVQLEERLAARTEDVKNLSADVSALKTELKTVREQAIAAKSLSESNGDRLNQITWVGRLILGGVAFLIGVIVTQLVSRLMAAAKPRVIRTAG